MRIKPASLLLLALLSAVLLGGCRHTASAPITAFQNVRGAVGAYHAVQSVKDTMNAEPIFHGYAALVPQARLVPRDPARAAQIQAAFIANLQYLLETDARIVGAPLSVYAAPPPGLRTLIVQFVEDDYGHGSSQVANVVNAVTVGDKLTGTLLFTDATTGAVVAQKKVEIAPTYGAVTRQIQAHLIGPLLKTLPPEKLSGNLERLNGELSKVQIVAPPYAPLLGQS